MQGAVGCTTEDGASNNKKANKILGETQKVCYPHDIARAVLTAAGETGNPNQNIALQSFTSRVSKQSAAFSRSVVANVDLQDAQLAAEPDLKPHQALTTKTKNTTRWLGLHLMCQRKRLLGPEIRMSLTGDPNGVSVEIPAAPTPRPNDSSSDNNSDNASDDEHASNALSDGDNQEEGNRAAGKKYPLVHGVLL